MSLEIEIASRAKFEFYGEYKDDKKMTVMRYRFDLTHVFGDAELIDIPLPFASEESARLKLYERLIEYKNRQAS